MFEYVQRLAVSNPLDFYTAVIATFGVVFWVADRRSMKVALRAARGSEIAALRLKRQEVEIDVKRSLATLQIDCQAKRDMWRNHNWRNGPVLGSGFHMSLEQKEISRIQRSGELLVEQLNASAPKSDSSEIDKLEAYFAAAGHTSLQIERLASELPKPKIFSH
jgi:hypothetical protein